MWQSRPPPSAEGTSLVFFSYLVPCVRPPRGGDVGIKRPDRGE
jgi:hypothetical protein